MEDLWFHAAQIGNAQDEDVDNLRLLLRLTGRYEPKLKSLLRFSQIGPGESIPICQEKGIEVSMTIGAIRIDRNDLAGNKPMIGLCHYFIISVDFDNNPS